MPSGGGHSSQNIFYRITRPRYRRSLPLLFYSCGVRRTHGRGDRLWREHATIHWNESSVNERARMCRPVENDTRLFVFFFRNTERVFLHVRTVYSREIGGLMQFGIGFFFFVSAVVIACRSAHGFGFAATFENYFAQIVEWRLISIGQPLISMGGGEVK